VPIMVSTLKNEVIQTDFTLSLSALPIKTRGSVSAIKNLFLDYGCRLSIVSITATAYSMHTFVNYVSFIQFFFDAQASKLGFI